MKLDQSDLVQQQQGVKKMKATKYYTVRRVHQYQMENKHLKELTKEAQGFARNAQNIAEKTIESAEKLVVRVKHLQEALEAERAESAKWKALAEDALLENAKTINEFNQLLGI